MSGVVPKEPFLEACVGCFFATGRLDENVLLRVILGATPHPRNHNEPPLVHRTPLGRFSVGSLVWHLPLLGAFSHQKWHQKFWLYLAFSGGVGFVWVRCTSDDPLLLLLNL